MAWKVVIHSFLLAIIVCLCAGKLRLKPRDTDAKVNRSTYFNCSTDIVSSDIFWFHGTNYIYTGSAILEPYHERFRVDRYAWNGTHNYNLIILSVQPGDTGEYTCVDEEGIGEKHSVQLVVFDGDPTCRSSIELDKVIGQNTCNVKPDEVELSCSVTYHGNIPPQLEWKKGGDDKNIAQGLSNVITANHYNYIMKLKGDISIDKSSYICETTRVAHEPRKCTSKVIHILYALSDNSTVNRTINDEITCHANTTQSCNYQWRWFQNDDVTTESSSAILKPRKTGLHKCDAECYLRNKTCNLLVMEAIVYEDTESSQTKNVIISVVVGVVVTLALVVTLVCAFRLRHWIAWYRNRPKGQIEKNHSKHLLPSNHLPLNSFEPSSIDGHNPALKSQLKLPDELSSLPIITSQEMVDQLTVNQYFMDRGTSGAIYGPFRWKNKKCAFKQVLYSPDELTKTMEDNIHKQANRYKKLDHLHLVKVFEVWFSSPALYILMEYAEGKSLDKILRPKDAPPPFQPYSNDVVRNWALQIADGMKYLHFNDLVHRNLKAAHVMVMESPDVLPNTLKIGSYTPIKQHDHATIMSVKGTMHWMAPEYIRGDKFEKSSDVWSYGVTVWEILTRDIPFNEVRKETDIVKAAINKTLKLKIPDSCAEPLHKLLTDCWNYEVDKRHSFQWICDYLRAPTEVTCVIEIPKTNFM